MINSQLVQSVFIKSWRPYLWIALASFLLYGHVIYSSGYTYYDDYLLIVDKYSKIDELSDIGSQFLEDVGHEATGGNLYRPILNVSFIFGTQISGKQLWGHFLINILIHTGSCLFLFVVLVNLGASRVIGFILSLIFTIHPALTQSIAWISGRNDSLLAFFILLCFISFLKFMSSSSYKWYFAHLLFFFLALFTKETAIFFPFVLLLYIFIVYKEKANKIQIIGLIIAWIIVFINWYILRIAAQITRFSSPLEVIKNLFSDLWIVFFYFGKIFWPVDLTFAPQYSDIHILAGVLSAIFLLGIIFISDNCNRKILLFGIIWFGFLLIPSFIYHPNKLGIHIPYYEHRIYVPMIGIFILLSSLTFTKKIHLFKKLIPYLLTVVIVFLAGKSYSQTLHFQNYLTLKQYAAKSSPHDRWLYNTIERMSLPLSLQQQIQNYKIPLDTAVIDAGDSTGNCKRIRDILETLESKFKNDASNKELAHMLAIVNYARGFLIRAEELFHSAKILDPQNDEIPYNLGILYYDAHFYKQTELEWLLSLKLNPSFGNAYINLVYLYYEQGEFEKAWSNCQLALKQGIIVPDALIKAIKSKLHV
jgi:protein O-mannosyl-transferase